MRHKVEKEKKNCTSRNRTRVPLKHINIYIKAYTNTYIDTFHKYTYIITFVIRYTTYGKFKVITVFVYKAFLSKIYAKVYHLWHVYYLFKIKMKTVTPVCPFGAL